jgi:hypothetical protein
MAPLVGHFSFDTHHGKSIRLWILEKNRYLFKILLITRLRGRIGPASQGAVTP